MLFAALPVINKPGLMDRVFETRVSEKNVYFKIKISRRLGRLSNIHDEEKMCKPLSAGLIVTFQFRSDKRFWERTYRNLKERLTEQ